jgi:hypothetical protein
VALAYLVKDSAVVQARYLQSQLHIPRQVVVVVQQPLALTQLLTMQATAVMDQILIQR